MNIYFLRHGESKSDLENRIESRYDAELTQNGLNQAQGAAKYFHQNQIIFDRIFSSPLKRAAKTAESIAIEQKINLEFDYDLSEVDRGVLCGLERSIADIKYPKKPYRTHYDHYPNNSGESVYQIRERSNRILQKIMTLDCETVLIVTHGSFLNSMLSTLLMMPTAFNESTGCFFNFGDCEYVHLKTKANTDQYLIMEKRKACL